MGNLGKYLEDLKGKKVDIYTRHKLFGNQHLCTDYFIPEIKLGKGFKFKDQVIYIRDDDIVDYSIEKCKITINGNKFSIQIISGS